MKKILFIILLLGSTSFADTSPWIWGSLGPLSLQTLAGSVCRSNGDELICDATTTNLPEGSNLYFTNARAQAAISATSPLTYSLGVVGCQTASTSLAGCLTSSDWNTFNNKQAALTFTLPLLNTANTITINNFTGASGGAVGLAGAVPAPTINQDLTNKYLSAAGTFTHPGVKKTPAEGVIGVSTWTGRTASAANQWFGMAWSPELHLFCSIASSGTNRVQWSRDGITWTAASAAAARVWTKIAWSPELRLFAAVAFDGTTADNVMTSPDCKTWTSRTGTEANQWYDIKWAPALSKFLAVSINGTNRCMSSTDGITWSTCSMAAAIQWYSVAWSPELNLYAAVAITASGGNYAATSPDGVTWTMRALTTGNTWYSVTWAPEIGLFVAVGVTGTNRCATSPDGITWTLRAIQARQWRRVTWSPELRLLVAVSSDGFISTSADGITWNNRTSPEANQWYEVIWSPELMKFVGSSITGTTRILNSKEIGTVVGSKLANYATPSNTAEQIIRRDQNGAFSAGAVSATSALLNSGVAATNAVAVVNNGHLKFTQTTAPVATVDANAGTSATCAVVASGTDNRFTLRLTTGSAAWAAGNQCSVAFNVTYANIPACVLTAGSTAGSTSGADNNAAAAALNVSLVKTLTTVALKFKNADVAATSYEWDVICAE